MVKLTNEELDKRLLNSNVVRANDYADAKTGVQLRCKICNHIWTTEAGCVGTKTGCSPCARTKSGQLRSTPVNKVDEKLSKLNIKRLDEYKNNSIKMRFKCLLCNKNWVTKLAHIFISKSTCPHCNSNVHNKNENYIFDLLKGTNLNYYHNYGIKKIDKTQIHNYRIDFYLPDIKIAIEYNGRQHYEPVSFSKDKSGSKTDLEKQILRDKYVENFCNDNGIKLIWIDGRIYKGDKLKSYVIDELIPNLKKE